MGRGKEDNMSRVEDKKRYGSRVEDKERIGSRVENKRIIWV